MNPADIKAGPLPDIDTLEIVADWRVDLTSRIRRARLRQEFDGVSPEEIIALSAETAGLQAPSSSSQGGDPSCVSGTIDSPRRYLTARSC